MYILAAVFAVVVVCLAIGYFITFYSPVGKVRSFHHLPAAAATHKQRECLHALIDELLEKEYEEVAIKSHDGLDLFGRYYHRSDTAPLMLCVHGWHGSAVRDFCGGARLALSLGMNVLIVDQRAHQKSGGRTLTFGLRERYDCLNWARYAADRFGEDTKIVLHGVSMGAATVLMASALEIPANVCGVIADSAYSSVKGVLRCFCISNRVDPVIGYPVLALSGRLFARIDPTDGVITEEIKKTRVPVLLIHGDKDTLIPCEMSRDIAAANPEYTQCVIFEGAAHGILFADDEEKYNEVITGFLREKCRIAV